MRIAIATNEKGFLKDRVALHFGKAKNFLIYNTKTKSFEVFLNPETSGGKELPPDFLHRQGVEIVIAFGLGPAAFEKFKNYEIEMYKATEGTILDNVQNFKNGKLEKLKKEDIF